MCYLINKFLRNQKFNTIKNNNLIIWSRLFRCLNYILISIWYLNNRTISLYWYPWNVVKILQSDVKIINNYSSKKLADLERNSIRIENKVAHFIIDPFHSLNFAIQNSRTAWKHRNGKRNSYAHIHSTRSFVSNLIPTFRAKSSNSTVSNLSALIQYRPRSRHKLPDTQYARTHANGRDVHSASKQRGIQAAHEECHVTPFLHQLVELASIKNGRTASG